MKLGAALFILIPAVSLVGNVQAAAPSMGRFTNVRYIPEAGDYVGLNLKVLPGPKAAVGYELCEGWCNGALTFPAVVSNSTIRFTVRQELVDQDGKPVEPLVYRVEARVVQTPLGRRMIVTSPDNREFREVLKPVKRER